MDEASILAHDLGSGSKYYYRASEFAVELLNTYQKGKQPGETSHIKCLDEIFTIRPGFLYCFTGWPGSGKSEFITQITVLQAYFKNRKTAIYSPESYPMEEFIDTVIHCYLGKSTDSRFGNVCSQDEYKKGIQWASENYLFLDWAESPDCAGILRSFQHLHDNEGVKIFVVDPFNSLIAEGEERNIALGLKRNLTLFKRFAAQNKAVVFLIEHPKTPNENSEYDKCPTNRNLFGGTMWWNKVDVGVSIHRPNRDDKNDNTVTFKSWKVKRQELNGRPGDATIHFSIKSKRYYPDVYCMDHPMKQMSIEEIKQINDDQPF